MRLLASSIAAFAVALLLLESSAHAQAGAVLERFQTDGVALPPTGAALVDEATAPEVNPAGLALLAKPQLVYLHERNLRQDRIVDSVHIGTGLFGYGGVGLAMQFIRPKGVPSYRKTTLSLAAGGEFVSLGASFNDFSSDDAAFDALTTWDAGLALRPWKYLSLGFAIRDFDGPILSYSKVLPPGTTPPPGFEPRQIPRRFDVGLGIRPFTDRVQLAGDWLFDDQGGASESRFSFAAQVEPLAGLIVSGGVAFGLNGGEVVGQLALTLNTSYAGATWWGGAGDDVGGKWDQAVQLRLSADRYRALPIARDRVVVLDFSSLLSPSQGLLTSLIAPSTREPYLEILGLIERIRTSGEIAGVLIKVGKLPGIGHARVEELRRSLMSLRTAGKRVWAVWLDGGDDEYLLASAAERIWAVPQSTLAVNGYASTQTFLAGTLEKLGVTVDVARVGEYKTAPDSFTRTNMSPEEKQMLGAWLDEVFDSTVATIASARGLKEEDLRKTIGQGILSARMAKEAGLVDELVYPDQLQQMLEKGHGKSLDIVSEVPAQRAWPRRWGVRPKIAVINVEGLISDGKTREDPFGLLRIAGAESTLRELETAVRDPLTKAIVLRVDSSGGSGEASDLVWRAVTKVNEYKPVVVSMGDMAASGGYYVAMAGQRVFAEPSTLTGSIGVFAIKPDLGGLLEKLGVRQETLRRGERSDLYSLTRPWTEGEKQAVQTAIDEFYDVFITRVAEARKMEKVQVDALGRGRIFSGVAALQAGLVDEIGGLQDAISWAKERAGLSGKEVDVEVVRDGGGLMDLKLGTNQSEALTRVGRSLGDAAASVGVALELPQGPLALLPYRVTAK
ncbi:MAG TPA: signal peptide peptidase SppA [Myxococcales bacterium]|jgi:protease-4